MIYLEGFMTLQKQYIEQQEGVYDLLGGLYSNSGRVNHILERVMMQSNDVQARNWKSIEILK